MNFQLTDIHELYFLRLHNELQSFAHVLHLLHGPFWDFVVSAKTFSREHLQQYDELHSVAEGGAQVIYLDALNLEVLVTPSLEGLGLYSLPFRLLILLSCH